MAVKFCVVAADSAEAVNIVGVARPFAEIDPYGRELVEKGGDGFPSAEDLSKWAKESNIESPGAVVLKEDGSFSSILSIPDAKNGGMIEGAFLDAI